MLNSSIYNKTKNKQTSNNYFFKNIFIFLSFYPSTFLYFNSVFLRLPFYFLTFKFLYFSTAYCLLSTVYCLLSTVYCLLPTIYCLLLTIYCLQSPKHIITTLFVKHSQGYTGSVNNLLLLPNIGFPIPNTR